MEQIVYDKQFLLRLRADIEKFIKSLDGSLDKYFAGIKNDRYSVGELFPMFWDDKDFGSFLKTSAYIDQYKESIKKESIKLIEEIDKRIKAFDELHKIEI